MKISRFAQYAWAMLTLNIFVILWGAFVRASGSGAGCGSRWPTCDGAVLSQPESAEMLVEFIHRLTSGVALLGVAGLFVWAWRTYPPGHRVRTGARLSLIFIVIEALIGAGLVLFELVAFNVSLARAVMIAVHLLNTFFLLAALTLTGWWASGGGPLGRPASRRVGWAFAGAALALLILGASGAITALGDTLLLTAGIDPAQSPLLAALIGLRIYHPTLAVVTGLLLWGAVRVSGSRAQAGGLAQSTGTGLLGLYVLQFALGLLNVYLKAPVWLQLVHLLLADLIWIFFVLLAAQVFRRAAASAPALASSPPGEAIASPSAAAGS